jgi:hypothetical protein|tara:strand:- start:103 stop:435 length:333 start_codon:yes stop_codon:yes gene_type:complete
MVEFIEDTLNQRCVCKTDKLNTDIIIQKANDGFIFFEIKFENGLLPEDFRGKYSGIPSAKKAVENYLKDKKESKTVRRDNFTKAREERKKQDGAEIKSKGSKHVHQGSSN